MANTFFPLEIWLQIVVHLSRNQARKLMVVDYIADLIKQYIYCSIEIGKVFYYKTKNEWTIPSNGSNSLTLSSNELLSILRSQDYIYVKELRLNCTPVSEMMEISNALEELSIQQNNELTIYGNFRSSYDADSALNLLELAELVTDVRFGSKMERSKLIGYIQTPLFKTYSLAKHKECCLKLAKIDLRRFDSHVMGGLVTYELPCLRELKMALPPIIEECHECRWIGFSILENAKNLEYLKLSDETAPRVGTVCFLAWTPRLKVFDMTCCFGSAISSIRLIYRCFWILNKPI